MSNSKRISPPSINENFQDRNISSAVCRSTPNGLNNLNSEINKCTSSTEQNRNTNFAANTFKLQKDIESLRANVGDSLALGDNMYGQYGHNDISKQVKARNIELKSKKESLITDVNKKEATIERSNRDFSDVKDTLPETQPKKVLHFIEDYTLAILSISYLFMIMAAIYIYTVLAEHKLAAFGKSAVTSIILTSFMTVILYYLS